MASISFVVNSWKIEWQQARIVINLRDFGGTQKLWTRQICPEKRKPNPPTNCPKIYSQLYRKIYLPQKLPNELLPKLHTPKNRKKHLQIYRHLKNYRNTAKHFASILWLQARSRSIPSGRWAASAEFRAAAFRATGSRPEKSWEAGRGRCVVSQEDVGSGPD